MEILHAFVTSALVYLAIGSFAWLVLDQCGVIENALEAKRRARGRPVTLPFAVLASVAMILVWPMFAWIAVRRRKQVSAALKRAVWR